MTDDTDARARTRIGRVLDGKWTLERMLGIGGMAAVYAARHRNGARAAVKMLHPELAKHEQIRERFLREGYAANRVEHLGAVAVLDDDVVKEGPDAGAAYIVMELLEGELLEDRAARGMPPERELLLIAESILEVLEAAHAHGVVHRDLKPDNLFLVKTKDDSPRVKVLDFGLARVTEGGLQTRAGMTLGTPAYMSPEQASGRADEIDGRSDLYSLGAVLFRLRTGKRVHEAGTALELVTKMATLPAPPITDVEPTVSPSLAAIIDRALAFEREERYPDASAMRADVRAALAELEVPTTAEAPPTIVEPPRGATGRFIFGLLVLGGIAFVAIWIVRAGALPNGMIARTHEAPVLSASSDTAPDVPDDASTMAADGTAEAVALAVVDDAYTADVPGDGSDDEEEEDDDDAALGDAVASATTELASDAALTDGVADALDDGDSPAATSAALAPTTKKSAAPAAKPSPPPPPKKKAAPPPTVKKKRKKK